MTLASRISELISTNLGTKVVSVIIAIVLWFVVLGSRNMEVTKEISLELVTPSDIVASNDIPEKIAFRLSGPKAFLRAILDRREDPIRVNLAGAKPGLVTYRFFSDNIRVPIGVKVLSINPTAILIKLENVKRREVPVHAELRGVPPDGFKIAKTEMVPAMVRIKGAESRVDSITEITTLPIDVSGLKQSMNREVPLDLARYGVQIEGTLPKAVIDVEGTSANFRIKNVEIRVLSPYAATLEEKNLTVLVHAAPKDLKNLDKSHVYAVVDLRGRPKGKYTESVRVTLPENVGLVKAIPEQVTVTLK